MRRVIGFGRCLIPAVVLAASAGCDRQGPNPVEQSNALTMAVAWKQTAAEYGALYHQGFNVARSRIEATLEVRRRAAIRPERPLAVIADLDDTMLDTRGYWREMMAAGLDFFDDARWDAWVATNGVAASPGAIDFLAFCHGHGVAVFFITSRDQGGRTADLALENMRTAGLPYADHEHLTVLAGTSNKETRQQEIEKDHDVVVFLGDNLNDFRRRYYVTDVDERRRLMTEDQAEFGTRFILFPNPTDGHWVRAIFGDSEPPPSADNRERLRRAAGAARRP